MVGPAAEGATMFKSLAVIAVEAEEASDPEVASEPASARDRKCGRCRQIVPGDPGLHPVAHLGWWLCPPCREALVGHQYRGRS